MGTHRRHNSFRATSSVSDVASNARKAATRSAKKNSSILLSAIVLRISSLLWILVGVLWKKVIGVYIWMLKLAEQYFAFLTGWSSPVKQTPAIKEVAQDTRKDLVAATIEALNETRRMTYQSAGYRPASGTYGAPPCGEAAGQSYGI
ncbi:hypothetical protein DdX_05746 [Ditylenchus destructor]|uniref:Uncharacterized protein n=1 Tax=Ditylenchus destructor TaxID=166010 RepID=A0AAD4R9X6_9BILA|nr:hypothetical protein DdX_05746 [Ditylenchus destructor]